MLRVALVLLLCATFTVSVASAAIDAATAADSAVEGGAGRVDAGQTSGDAAWDAQAPPDAAGNVDDAASVQSIEDAATDADAEVSSTSAEELEAGPDAADVAPPEPVPPPATTSETRPKPVASEERTRLAVTTVIGLLLLLVLAYVANHPRVRKLEQLLGVQSAITAGFPFVALGLLAHRPEIGVLSDEVLVGLTPLVEFGLGWLGFVVGFKLEARALERLPRGTALVVIAGAVLPFVTIALVCGLLLLLLGVPWEGGLFLRSGIVLGAAGAMTAPSAIRAVLPADQRESVAQHLDEVVGVAGLALIAAYFRPLDVTATWVLPGTGWLFLTLGMGTTLGGVLYVTLWRPASHAEFIAIAVGAIAFTGGMAAYLHLSPMVVCFLAGLVMANLPSARREALAAVLMRMERPVFLVFLTLAGALWDPRDWRGWALLPAFLASRYLGLWLGRGIAARREPHAFEASRPHSTWIAPVSIVAIAVVVNVRGLYREPIVPLMITAVIAGALGTELISALAMRVKRPRAGP